MDHIVNMRNPLPPSLRPLEKASVWALCAAAFCIVLVFAPTDTIPFLPTKTAVTVGFALLALVLYILARLGRGNLILPPPALLGALWLPALAYLLSEVAHGFRAAYLWGGRFGIDSVVFVLGVTMLGTITALALRNANHYAALMKALVATAGCLLVLEIGALILNRFGSGSVENISIVGSSLDLSLLLGLIIMGGLYALRTLELGRAARVTLWVGIGASLALLAVFSSLVVWLAIALTSFGFFIDGSLLRRTIHAEDIEDLGEGALIKEASEETDSVKYAMHRFMVPLVVFIISVFFLFASLPTLLAGALHISLTTVRPSWQATFTILQKAYGDDPVFGSGPTTFPQEWSRYHEASLNASPFWNFDFGTSVGDLPTSFITTGLLGLLAWLVFLSCFAVAGVRAAILQPPQDPFLRFVLTGSFLGAAFLFVVMFFDVPGPAVIALAFMFAGLFISARRFGEESGGQWGLIFARAPRLALGIVVVLTLLLLGSVAAAWPIYTQYYSNVEIARLQAAASGGYERLHTVLENALLAAPSAPLDYLAALSANSHLNDILANPGNDQAAARQNFQTTLTEGIQAALRATKISPDQYRNWIALGSLYSTVVPFKVDGAYDGAKSAYEKAQALNPNDPEIPYLLAQLEIANGNTQAAESDLKAAIALKQDYTSAIILLSRLQLTDGNIKDALAASEAAAYFTPTDSNVLFQLGILRAATGNLKGAALALQGAVAVNPSSANARYFLAVVETKLKDYQDALAQVKAIAALSTANANAVAGIQTALAAGHDPFPANILSASSTPVQ